MTNRTVDTQFLTNVLVIPKARTATSPQVLAWNLGAVTLDKMEFAFPAGCAFLAFIQIWYAGTVILPWGNPGTWLAGNAETVEAAVGMDIDGGLVVQGYNLDKVNAHSVYLRAHVTATVSLGETASPAAQQAITPAGTGDVPTAQLAASATQAALPTVADELTTGDLAPVAS